MSRTVKLFAAIALTLGVAVVATSPAHASTRTWSKVSTGTFSTCAIRPSQSLYCWGYNPHGQLGVGDANLRLVPTRVGTTTWSTVSVGTDTTCAIRPTQSLYCWGRNDSGEIGNGSTTESHTPVHVGAMKWKAVDVGSFGTCGITTSSKLYCWGYGGYGLLGTGNSTEVHAPVRVGNHADWSRISVTGTHACAIRKGQPYCWGQNDTGQLGDGTTTTRYAPVHVLGTHTDWTSISAGDDYSSSHTCGVRHGHAYCWGYNNHGQLGNGTSTYSHAPVRLGSSYDPWSTISAGDTSSCGLRKNHTILCWGYDADGELGDGHNAIRLKPHQESLKHTDWITVASGFEHSCAIRSTGTLYCWGYNGDGELGNNTTADDNTPTLVH